MLLSEIAAALEVGKVFDDLSVPWVVGGSVASSLQGVPRATADVDLVADLRLLHAAALVNALEATYYVVADVVRWAIRERRSFNVIQLESVTKVDVFCCPDDPLSRAQLTRRRTVVYQGRQLPILSSEDVILQKLRWYEQGGEVSDRQWQDALAVARLRRAELDRDYLESQARAAGLDALLRRLLAPPDPED
jgi:hypothetical protein